MIKALKLKKKNQKFIKNFFKKSFYIEMDVQNSHIQDGSSGSSFFLFFKD